MRKPRAPRSVRESLHEALKAATMENASFGWPDDIVTRHGRTVTVDTFVKERTKIYRESWIIWRLEAVLRWAEGEELK